jgi:2-keto-4-pentenoate hydratase
MERALARRAELLGEGARPLGWKLAFGADAAKEMLGLTGPLVGFLTDATAVSPGADVSVANWSAPKLEPEIGIRLGPGGRGVAAVTPAIELADVDRPPTEVEEVLAGDIYHRAVVLGQFVPGPAGPVAVTVECNGDEIATTADAEATVGRLEALAEYVPEYLAHFGVETREGEVVISGATVPLVDATPGQAWTHWVGGVGTLEVGIV